MVNVLTLLKLAEEKCYPGTLLALITSSLNGATVYGMTLSVCLWGFGRQDLKNDVNNGRANEGQRGHLWTNFNLPCFSRISVRTSSSCGILCSKHLLLHVIIGVKEIQFYYLLPFNFVIFLILFGQDCFTCSMKINIVYFVPFT